MDAFLRRSGVACTEIVVGLNQSGNMKSLEDTAMIVFEDTSVLSFVVLSNFYDMYFLQLSKRPLAPG